MKHTKYRTDYVLSIDNLDNAFAVMICCARDVSYRSHPASIPASKSRFQQVSYRCHPANVVQTARIIWYTRNLSFFPSHLLSSLFFSLSLLVVTQIRGHIAGSSPPSRLRFVPCIFCPEKTSALSSLVDWRQIAPAPKRSRE